MSNVVAKPPEITVAIFDDHRQTCEDLRDLLNATPGFRCVLAGLSLRNVVRRIEQANPDVVILDIHFPGESGLSALADLRKARPRQRVLMQTAIDSGDEILLAYRLGASGYILKGDGPNRILSAIELVAEGSSIFSPRIARELQRLTMGVEGTDWVLKLTPAEVEVLEQLAKGSNAVKIAEMRGASVSTVNKQCEAIRRKAEIHNMREAIVGVAPWVRILQKFWNLWHHKDPKPPNAP